MGRKKSPTSEMDAGEKARTPLAQRLFDTISDPVTLAGKLGVSPQAVSQYRNGGAQPTLERLCQIADIYGVSVDYLLGRTDVPSKSADVRAACEYTGLTPGAVEEIHALKEHNAEYQDILSVFIEGIGISYWLYLLSKRFQYNKKVQAKIEVKGNRAFIMNPGEFHKSMEDFTMRVPFDGDSIIADKRNFLDGMISAEITSKLSALAASYENMKKEKPNNGKHHENG